MDPELRKRMDLHHKKILPLISKYLKNKRMLDAGCGTGMNSVFLKEKLKCIPILSDIRDLREKPAKIFPFYKASISKMPFHDKEFDVAFVQYVLHHVSSKFKINNVLKELKRVTKGEIVIIEETVTKNTDIKQAIKHDLEINVRLHPSLADEKIKFYTEKELKEAFKASGLKIIEETVVKKETETDGGLLKKLYVLKRE